ncbi:terpenoid synthase [Pluteus cervinus]|uniref:Terpenoid synthase n=1 Tax=Pluteus cervinus TaxID=181527 RepID=A0ACD3B4V5_9AGAR|nr:terpenoid synthase [Pluteus cervinus]
MRRWPRAPKLSHSSGPSRLCSSSTTLYTQRRCNSTLGSPLENAPTGTPNAEGKPPVDPFALVAPSLKKLRASILPLLTSGHPALTELTSYYFLHPSKQIRPLLVLLFSRATNGLGSQWETKLWHSQCVGAGGREEELNWPLGRPDVLNDWNPSMPEGVTGKWESGFVVGQPVHPRLRPSATPRPGSTSVPASSPLPSSMSSKRVPTLANPPTILPTQIRFAQILEFIHCASLLHDDVIDASPLRRGAPSAPAAFGNKLSVLGAVYILGRTSAMLSRLGDPEVTELTASITSNLVEGEILQMKDVVNGRAGGAARALVGSSSETDPSILPTSPRIRQAWNVYLQKTYLKTASLMAKGARSAVILGGCQEGEIYREVAYAYGRNLGIAFQLVDDVLDYASPSDTLGKPGGADLQLGLATGPALFAWEEHPEMGELIGRKFESPGDVELARKLVHDSSGVQRTRELARAYADKAKEVLLHLPESEARQALEALAEKVIGRNA